MFKGKTAIVTGASSGIGKSIAVLLGKNNCNVVVNYSSNESGAKETVKIINTSGGNAFALRADVRDSKEVKLLVDETVKKFGSVDFLVNNAGITKDALFVNMSEEAWGEVIDVNLGGAFNCTKHVLPILLSKGFGRIINLSSISGQSGNIGQANYAASKAGIIGFTKSLAKEVASKGVNVNAVAPGLINTSMHESIPEKVMEKFLDRIPMKRIGEPEEVAELVVFLLSEKANYITGEVINVNGGLY